MFSIRWRKVLRDLWSNKTRTMLVVLSIAVGVFAVGVIMTTSTVLSREMNQSYVAVKPASASVFASGVDDDMVETIRKMPEVDEAEGRMSYILRAKVGSGDWKGIVVMALADYEDVRVDIVRPVSGDWPPAKRDILIERSGMAFLGAKVGDVLTLESYDGTQRELRITGVAHDVNQFPSFLANRAYGYIHRDTLEWLGLGTAYTDVRVRAGADQQTLEGYKAVAEAVEDKLEKGGHDVWGYYTATPGRHPADEIIAPLLMVLGVLGTLSLGLSGFLVINTISAILTQQIRQIGIMKAIGGRRRQIIGLYFMMVLIFGLLSLAVAIPLGAFVATLFTNYMAQLINFNVQSYSVPTNVLAIEMTVGLLAPILAAMVPVWSGTRVTAREAMSAYGISNAKQRVGLIDRLLEHVRGLPRPLLLSLRNTFRRKSRLMLTLITLTLGGGIFVGVLTTYESLMTSLDDALAYWNHEVTIQFRRPYRNEKIVDESLRMPGVVGAESWEIDTIERVRADESQSETIYVIAPPAATDMIKPILIGGRWLLPEDDNAVVINTEVLKKESDIKVGDTITLRLDKNGDKIDRPFHVVGIVKGVMTGPIAYINYPYYAKLMGRVGRAYSVRIQLEDKSPASQVAMAKALEAHFNRAGLQVNSWRATSSDREQAKKQLDIMIMLLLSMSVLLAIVGGLGLMGTMSINVIERTREVGVMRAIGASNGAILKVIIVEGMLIGGISWALATLVAVPLSQGLCQMVGDAVLRSSLSYTFSYGGVALWLGVVMVIGALASFLPAHRASQLTVRDVLAYE